MTIDEIKELLRIFNESGVGELELERGDYRIRISRGGGGAPSAATVSGGWPVVITPAASHPTTSGHAATPASAPAPVASEPAAAAAPVESEHALVKSPIVGTYYDQPSPGSAPFVKVGDSVEPGQVLCIIESMKLMNEIEAEIAGTVMSKLVENGKPVEYGAPLFAIRPR